MASITEPAEKLLPTTQPDTEPITKEGETEKSQPSADPPSPTDGKTEMEKKLKGIPPIDLGELNSLLRNPNMPQKKILHEVADKVIQSRNDHNKNKGCEMITGMKSLFDCILEVSLHHIESDEEEEEDDIPLNRQFACLYCQKVFTSSMDMKTHILVLHSNQDSSVLNLRKLIASEGQKITPAHRTKSRDSNKADGEVKETKSRHPSRGEKTSSKVRDENIPVNRSARSQAKAKGEGKSQPASPDDTGLKGSPPVTPVRNPDIYSDNVVASINPTSSSDQPSKDLSRVSSQGDKDVEQTKSTEKEDPGEGSDNISSKVESESPSKSARKRQTKDEEAAATTSSPVKRGRRSRSSQGEAASEDTKPTTRRSSLRH